MNPLDGDPAEGDTGRARGRIRIVDGDPAFLLVLTQALRDQGYDCRDVQGGDCVESPSGALLEVLPASAAPDGGDTASCVPGASAPPAGDPARPARLEEVIRRHVLEVFHATHDNVTRTALALGISRVALRRRLREYGAKPQP